MAIPSALNGNLKLPVIVAPMVDEAASSFITRFSCASRAARMP